MSSMKEKENNESNAEGDPVKEISFCPVRCHCHSYTTASTTGMVISLELVGFSQPAESLPEVHVDVAEDDEVELERLLTLVGTSLT